MVPPLLILKDIKREPLAYVLKIFGGDIPYHLALVILGDILFITSLFVLGGEFWDKLQSLFVHSISVTGNHELET